MVVVAQDNIIAVVAGARTVPHISGTAEAAPGGSSSRRGGSRHWWLVPVLLAVSVSVENAGRPCGRVESGGLYMLVRMNV